MTSARRALLFGLAVLLLAGRGGEARHSPEFGIRPEGASPPQEYRIAVYPLHPPARLYALDGPLVDRLDRALPEPG